MIFIIYESVFLNSESMIEIALLHLLNYMLKQYTIMILLLYKLNEIDNINAYDEVDYAEKSA